MTTTTSPAMQHIPEILARGVKTVRTGFALRMVLAVVVLLVAGAARLIAQTHVDEGRVLVPLLIDFSGMTVATILALPWFRIVLRIERGQAATIDGDLKWAAMTVGALYFWGGVFLGLRYLIGIPSIFVLIWYGFFGFAVAEGASSGLKALGVSVRIGQGRRAVVALVAALLLVFNLFAAFPLAIGVTPLTAAATVAVLALSTNVSMGAGAHLYVRLLESEAT